MSVRPIAQQEPIEVLCARLGAVSLTAIKRTSALADALRELDGIRDQLKEYGIDADAHLAPIGDAARAARRDLERESGRPSFSFPKPR